MMKNDEIYTSIFDVNKMKTEAIHVSIDILDLASNAKDFDVDPVKLSSKHDKILRLLHRLNYVDEDSIDEDLIDAMLSMSDRFKLADMTTKSNKEKAVYNAVSLLKTVREDAYEEKDRTSLFPIKDFVSWKSYLTQDSLTWSASELDFGKDEIDFLKAPIPVKRALVYFFGMFAHLDNNVASNALFRFSMESETVEEMLFYGRQVAVEGVHIETYSKNIHSLVKDPKILAFINDAYKNIPSIRNKHKLADLYQNSHLPKEERLLAFAFIEGVFFMAAFSFFYWLRGLTSTDKIKFGFETSGFSNILIGKDEAVHRDHAIAILRHYLKLGMFTLTQERVHEMGRQICEVERIFLYDAAPKPFYGYDPDNALNDTKLLINNVCKALSFEPLYPDVTDLKIEEFRTFTSSFLGNFYEVQIGQYSKFDPLICFKQTTLLGLTEEEKAAIKKVEKADEDEEVSSEEEMVTAVFSDDE